MTRLAPVLALMALFAATPTLAQDTPEARLAAAREYVAATMAAFDTDELIRGMYRPMLEQVRGQGMAISDAQVAEIESLYLSTFRGPMEQILRDQDQIMAEMFTLAEIQALLSFYNTPEGRSIMTRMPQVIERQQPAIMALLQSTLPQLLPQLQRILTP